MKLTTDNDNPKRLKSMSENVLQLITTTMPHMDPVSVESVCVCVCVLCVSVYLLHI